MLSSTVILFGQRLRNDDVQYIDELCTKLKSFGYDIVLNKEFFTLLINTDLVVKYDLNAIDIANVSQAKALFSLGGDGTFLNAKKWLGAKDVPILGINMGRLGFLASIEQTKISEALDAWHQHKFVIQHRNLLQLSTDRSLFADFPFALNDFTIHKKDTSSMIVVHVYMNGEKLNSYWADGLIVSTPTGSTGYSLSCGGPIIHPGSGNIVVTPVAPHNLNVRPIVLPDYTSLELQVEGRADSYLCTLDSRYETIFETDKLTLTKAPFTADIISLENQSFLKTIRNKLTWGLDKRN